MENYKQFIDGLVGIRKSVIANRIRTGEWPGEPLPEHQPYRDLIEQLSDKQREVVAELIQWGADSAIHDSLVFITDKEYSINKGDTPLPVEPFDSPLHYDFVARKEGDPWPS